MSVPKRNRSTDDERTAVSASKMAKLHDSAGPTNSLVEERANKGNNEENGRDEAISIEADVPSRAKEPDEEEPDEEEPDEEEPDEEEPDEEEPDEEEPDEEEPDEEEANKEEANKELQDDWEDEDPMEPMNLGYYIYGIQNSGEFAVYNEQRAFPPPAFSVDGQIHVGVPLSAVTIKSLLQLSNAAPYGKGNTTLVDQSVRKTKEIDADRINITNPAWAAHVSDIAIEVVKGLGMNERAAKVSASLYKLLIYDEGAFFLPHQDTSRGPDMFATLVICLPSEHTGGNVVLEHKGRRKVFDSAKNSAFGISYLAWYSDVVHEIQPVTSGYRCVLVYQLQFSKDRPTSNYGSVPKEQSANQVTRAMKKTRFQLDEWFSNDDGYYACFPLNHEYSPSGLRIENLKGVDYTRVTHLINAGGSDYCILLAHLERSIEVGNDDGGEVMSDFVRLENIKNSKGFILRPERPISIDSILQDNLYFGIDSTESDHECYLFREKRVPDERNGGQYMGNQHASIEDMYHDTAMIIVPKDKLAPFLVKASTPAGFRHILAHLVRYGTANGSDKLKLFKSVCEWAISTRYSDRIQRDSYPYNVLTTRQHEFLGHIAVAAAATANVDLFERAVEATTAAFPLTNYHSLGTECLMETSAVKEHSLRVAVLKPGSLYNITQRIESLRVGHRSNEKRTEASSAQLDTWAESVISEFLRDLPTSENAILDIESVDAYIERVVSRPVENRERYFNDVIKPCLSCHITNGDQCNKIAAETVVNLSSESPRRETAELFWSTIAHQVEKCLQISKFKYYCNRSPTIKRTRNSGGQKRGSELLLRDLLTNMRKSLGEVPFWAAFSEAKKGLLDLMPKEVYGSISDDVVELTRILVNLAKANSDQLNQLLEGIIAGLDKYFDFFDTELSAYRRISYKENLEKGIKVLQLLPSGGRRDEKLSELQEKLKQGVEEK